MTVIAICQLFTAARILPCTVAGIVFCCLILSACRNESSSNAPALQEAATTAAAFHPVTIDEAAGFAVEYGEGYKLLSIIDHWEYDAAGQAPTRQYLLLPQHGDTSSLPDAVAQLPVVRVPVAGIITSSSSQSGLLDILGAADILRGHSVDNIWHPATNARVQSGGIALVGHGANLNIERVLALAPTVYMSYPQFGETSNVRATLEQAGIAVIANAEYLEPTILGRAEWLKLMAILVNREAEAEKIFTEVVRSYRELQQVAANAASKPVILVSTPSRGTWYASGGNSYEGRLFIDAGADYRFASDTHVGSITPAFEQMLALGLEADVWLNPRSDLDTLQEVLALDPRLADLKPFQSGEVYNFTKKAAPNGANDYWERGTVYPNEVLADLIHILHPELLPDHSLIYYEKLMP